MQKLALRLAVCIAALAQSALADEAPAPASPARGGEVRAACEADAKKLCPDVVPGGGRIMQCLKQHKDEVSEACKQAVMKARQNAPDKQS
jgi:Cysteine rich repeat